MCILIVSKLNLKHQVFGLFSRFVRTLIIKISSSEEPVNSTSIHRVRNGGKLVVLFHPSPKSITERCRSLSWKPARARWKYQNGAKRRTNFLGPPPPTPPTSDTAAKWVRMLGGFRASAFERLSRSDLWFQRGWRLPTNKQNAVLHFLGLMLIWSDRKIF